MAAIESSMFHEEEARLKRIITPTYLSQLLFPELDREKLALIFAATTTIAKARWPDRIGLIRWLIEAVPLIITNPEGYLNDLYSHITKVLPPDDQQRVKNVPLELVHTQTANVYAGESDNSGRRVYIDAGLVAYLTAANELLFQHVNLTEIDFSHSGPLEESIRGFRELSEAFELTGQFRLSGIPQQIGDVQPGVIIIRALYIVVQLAFLLAHELSHFLLGHSFGAARRQRAPEVNPKDRIHIELVNIYQWSLSPMQEEELAADRLAADIIGTYWCSNQSFSSVPDIWQAAIDCFLGYLTIAECAGAARSGDNQAYFDKLVYESTHPLAEHRRECLFPRLVILTLQPNIVSFPSSICIKQLGPFLDKMAGYVQDPMFETKLAISRGPKVGFYVNLSRMFNSETNWLARLPI